MVHNIPIQKGDSKGNAIGCRITEEKCSSLSKSGVIWVSVQYSSLLLYQGWRDMRLRRPLNKKAGTKHTEQPTERQISEWK